MIIKWQYNSNGEFRREVKSTIKENNYTSIDIGASMDYWSYPECKVVADAYPVKKEDVLYFKINLEDKDDWKDIREYVEKNGKFDYSICSHTLEDVFNPIELCEILSTISKRGYIAVPSKFNEFKKLFQNKYRGNAHHKQFFDVTNEELTIYPKYSWIETDDRSDEICTKQTEGELTLFWEGEIKPKIFGDGKPYFSDGQLINEYYNTLK
jgi:hypothetical protein